MRGACRVAFAAVVLAAVAAGTHAEDPPPGKAKHENKVTPEAKAVLERFQALVYRPEDHGLTSMSAAIVTLGFDRPVRSTFEFTTRDGIRPTDTEDIEKEQRRHELVGNAVGYPLRVAFDASGALADEELDASIETVGGERVLTTTAYRDGNPLFAARCFLEEHGLLRRREWRDLADRGREDFVETYSWIACGDRWLVETLDIVHAEPKASHQLYEFRYADVRGVRLVSSYDVRYVSRNAFALTCHVAGLVVNGKPVDLPTPWKHVNKVSPEAQVAMERYERLVDRATKHGLESISGALVSAGVANGKPRRFSFKAGEHVDIERENKPGESTDYRRGAQFGLAIAFEATLAGIPLADGPEYDAGFVDRGGVRTLFVTQFRDGAKLHTNTFTFNDRGLLATFELGGGEPTTRNSLRLSFSWLSSGELFRIAAIESVFESFADKTALRAVYELTYTDVAGAAIVTSYRFRCSGTNNGGNVNVEGTFFIADVVVNGARVDVPPPTVHETRISPEARRVIERYVQHRYLPAEHGLRSLSGTIARTWLENAGPLRFTYKAGAEIVVAPPEGLDPASPEGRGIGAAFAWPIMLAMTGMEIAGGPEFDAAFVERGGCRLLEIAGYARGKRTETRELDFDGNGLIAAMTLKNGEDPATAVTAARFRLDWEKAGERFRIARADIQRFIDGGKTVRTVAALSYSTIDGIDVITSFSLTESEEGGPRTYVYDLRDLVVNGKPVESPPVPADKR